MQSHLKEISLVPISEIRPHPRNRNNHSGDQIVRLANLLLYQGWRFPIVVSKRSGLMVAGHGRLLAAKHIGWTKVPVSLQDFESDEAEYAFMVSDNAIASWAELDLAGINMDVGDLGPDFDLDMLGIKDFVLEPADKYGDQDADELPEPGKALVELGDIYLLGNHRLCCGDSTSRAQVEKLMNGEKADMVFTDPPYGVGYDGGTTKRHKLANDDNDEMYAVAATMGFIFSSPEAPLYMWHAGTMSAAAAAAAAGWIIRSHIIWNKNMAQFGALSAQYKQKHEPAFYCFKKGQIVNWVGPTNEVTVWDIDRASKNEFHPTQKPVALAERAILNHNAELLFEPFCGSGSTLIACEKTNRKCYGMEIDPIYCGVILDRWAKFTGKDPIREDGKPWSEVKLG